MSECNYKKYIYDGTFQGLLTVIYNIYYSKTTPVEIIANCFEEASQDNFLYKKEYVDSNYEKALKVSNSIKNKISASALDNVYYAFLSSIKEKELAIYNYIKIGFVIGNKIDSMYYDKRVSSILKIVDKVTKEVMRMCGFIRFTYINNFYYAFYEPDHNITELLAPDFVQRFSDQCFIIHDGKRNIAAIYDTKEWIISHFSKQMILTDDLSTNNISYENLWKEYFNNISISERQNLRQQKLLMPERYRKNMLETT